MNRKVFLSILAMDSYQRGYAPGINGLATPTFGADGNATSVVKIGQATITRDSSSLKKDGVRQDVPVGFYALSYQWGSEKVISFRGTDFDAANGGKILDSEFIKDFYAGWSTFTGLGDRSQFHFATSLGGVDFRPEMLSASYNNLTGQLAYTVNGVRGAARDVYAATGERQLAPMFEAIFEDAGLSRRAAAANDNEQGARRGAAFCFAGWRRAI